MKMWLRICCMVIFFSHVIDDRATTAWKIRFPSNFPTEVENIFGKERTLERLSKYVRQEKPKCARGKLYGSLCEKDEEYDVNSKEKFRVAIAQMNISKEVYDSLLSKLLIDAVVKVRSKADQFSDPICPSKPKIISPESGYTPSNKKVLILNQENFIQALSVEICDHLDGNNEIRSCSLCSNEISSEAECEQKYVYRQMIVMCKNCTKLSVESVSVPSNCVCERKKPRSTYGLRDLSPNEELVEEDPFQDLFTEWEGI